MMLLKRQSSLFAHILCMMRLVVRRTTISVPRRVAAEERCDTIYMLKKEMKLMAAWGMKVMGFSLVAELHLSSPMI